jgi:hypothetical protein
VLPLPVKPGLGEAALQFIDLAGVPTLFEILESLMSPMVMLPASRSQSFGLSLSLPTLVVHKVGSFEASFVPSQKDFGRLDPRFRLPPSVWDALPGVRDYGFAVFQLAKGRKKTIHPMAFRFVTREPGALFFPTVHVHDGRVHADASFDHSLYYQGVETEDPRSAMEVSEHTVERAKGLLVPGHLRRRRLNGKLPNRDTWIETRREARAA